MISTRSAVGITSVGVAAFTYGAVAGALPASATNPTLSPTICDGQTYDHTVAKYTNPGAGDLPLRCGDNVAAPSWGLRHIAYRNVVKPGSHPLDSSTNTKIQNTLTYGEPIDAGAKVLYDENCKPLYKVVYGYNAAGGNDPLANPIGIVSAFPQNLPVATVAAASAVSAASFRTDCPIIILIGD